MGDNLLNLAFILLLKGKWLKPNGKGGTIISDKTCWKGWDEGWWKKTERKWWANEGKKERKQESV